MEMTTLARPRESGFTIVEMAISLLVTVTVLLGVLALFDFSNKLTRVQTNVADMQQSLRTAQYDMVRLARMTGRGGLPMGSLPDGLAFSIRNNVAENERIGDPDSPLVLPETDVLTIRGIFSSSIYQIDAENPASLTLRGPAGAPIGGSLIIDSATPTGITQDLTAIREAIRLGNERGGNPEAILLVSSRDASVYTVVKLVPADSNAASADQVTLAFEVAAEYGRFSSEGPGVFPANMTSVAFAGILEEYRFYVREEHAIPDDPSSEITSKLSRARTYPGTNTPYLVGGGDNMQVDIADNIIDLQVAFGMDTANGGCSLEANETTCSIFESPDGEDDDWLYNDGSPADLATFSSAPLHYMRVTTLARTDRPDPKYRAPVIGRLEDHDYTDSRFNEDEDRMFRRRFLQTVIDMRNL
jgi:hypothetical protein